MQVSCSARRVHYLSHRCGFWGRHMKCFCTCINVPPFPEPVPVRCCSTSLSSEPGASDFAMICELAFSLSDVSVNWGTNGIISNKCQFVKILYQPAVLRLLALQRNRGCKFVASHSLHTKSEA